jgi:hypothetical protein
MNVIDNVIGDKYSELIFDECAKLPWTFVPDISFGSQAKRSVPGFSHSFYLDKEFNNNEPVTIESEKYSFIKPMLLEAFDKLCLDVNLNNVFRSRARLTLDRPELSEEDRIDNVHVDYQTPHLVLIYYVNNVDGDTLVYENNKLIESVTPRRGRCLLFNGSLQHTSTTPALGPRIIINNNIR